MPATKSVLPNVNRQGQKVVPVDGYVVPSPIITESEDNLVTEASDTLTTEN